MNQPCRKPSSLIAFSTSLFQRAIMPALMKNDACLSALGRRMTAPPISWLMSLALDRPELISLAAGFTDSETLPLVTARELLNGILTDPRAGQAALQYGPTPGTPDLRRLSVERVRFLDNASQSDAYDPARVVITHGSQQLLYLLAECLLDPGDIVLVEDPTYFVFLGIAQAFGIRCRGVKLTPGGMDLAELERVLTELKHTGGIKKLKFLYAITSHQNPTGITTPLENKAQTLALLRRYEKAAGHPLFYVEDAAYRELSFTPQTVPSTLTLGKLAQRVIYAGTYSKPFATGARVGFGILPEPVLTTVLRAKGNQDFGTATLIQALLSRAIETGEYDRHVQRIRARYQAKSQAMLSAMKAHFPDSVTWSDPTGGLYIWVQAKPSCATGPKSKLFKTALEQNVLYVPGQLCYADDLQRAKPNCQMRISFGSATDQDIRLGIERLGAALRRV
jgi:2-aminoadipate transaminase